MLTLMRPLSLLLVLAAALTLQACSSIGIPRDKLPLSPAATRALASLGTTAATPMLVRIFKESSELEVWKPDATGTYRLLKTYAICKWSGALGPKIREGDYQAPEGFYSVTPGMMNPQSKYYLSFNTGFPNKYDRAYGRTGTNLMVHGDCKSVGCYAVTDDQIREIYALARESFAGGNPRFQLELFPFRMTDDNLARYTANPNIEFWRNLKEGYDEFERSKRPATVDVCGGRYVFNFKNMTGGVLEPMEACPSQPATSLTS